MDADRLVNWLKGRNNESRFNLMTEPGNGYHRGRIDFIHEFIDWMRGSETLNTKGILDWLQTEAARMLLETGKLDDTSKVAEMLNRSGMFSGKDLDGAVDKAKSINGRIDLMGELRDFMWMMREDKDD